MSSLDVLAEQIRMGIRDGLSDSDLVRLVADAIHEFELIESATAAYVFQRTPIYFKSRGVMIDVANLVSV